MKNRTQTLTQLLYYFNPIRQIASSDYKTSLFNKLNYTLDTFSIVKCVYYWKCVYKNLNMVRVYHRKKWSFTVTYQLWKDFFKVLNVYLIAVLRFSLFLCPYSSLCRSEGQKLSKNILNCVKHYEMFLPWTNIFSISAMRMTASPLTVARNVTPLHLKQFMNIFITWSTYIWFCPPWRNLSTVCLLCPEIE